MKKVDELIQSLKDFDISRGGAVFLASFLKAHVMERKLDQVADTQFFQKLQELPTGKRLAVDGALHSLAAACEQLFGEDTFLVKVFKEIAEDIGPELSQRLNQGAPSRPSVSDAGKYTATTEKSADKLFIKVLLENLSLEEVVQVARWLKTATPEEKANILKYIKSLDAKKIMELGQLSPSEASDLFSAFEPPPEPKRQILPLTLGVLERRLDTYIAKNKKEKGDGK